MSCKFYYMDGSDYHCGKCNKDVTTDWYYKYCRNWDYDDCPVYRGRIPEPESPPSGCFLTSACTAARGLPDDCHELQTLRRFRDEWLKKQQDGVLLIAYYYEVAPRIVAAIDACSDHLEIYDRLYQELVSPCVRMIESGQNDDALLLYKDYTLKLEEMYLIGFQN